MAFKDAVRAWLNGTTVATEDIEDDAVTAAKLGADVSSLTTVDDATIELNVDTLRIKDGGVTTAKLAAAGVTSAKVDPTVIQTVAVAISNAELKALRAAPKTLVAAPGAGYVLEFIQALLILDYGANVLTESADNLVIRYKDGSGIAASEVIECTGFIDQAGDIMTVAVPDGGAATAIATKAQCDNQPLVLHNNGDGEFGGNAGADTLLRVKISYRVWPTGW